MTEQNLTEPNITESTPLTKAKDLESSENLSISFRQLLRFATRKDKVLMTIGTLAAIANGVALPAFALLFGNITDTLATSDNLIFDAGMISLEFFGIAIGTWIFSYISFSFWMISGERQGIEIRKRYFRALLRQEIAFFDSINPNELSTKIATECFDIQGGIGEKVVTFILSIAMLFSGFFIAYIKGWQLALVITAFFPITALCGTLFVYSIQKQTSFAAKTYAQAGGISEEALNGIRTVVSLGGEEKEATRYINALSQHKRAIIMFALFSGLSMGLLMFMDNALYAVGFGYGSVLIEDGTTNAISNAPYTGGDVLTIFFSIMFASFTISQATPALKKFALAKAAGARAFQIIDRQSKISIENQKGLKPSSIQGNIEFNNVSFAYPLKPNRTVLDGISFQVHRNEKIALVGESGCGKTTCLQLIERFYDCDQGSVTIDGNDIKTLNLRWLRENIGYVGQEPVLFATSIKENLLIAKEDATDNEIWDALKKANAADFVSHLPQQLDTFVGNNATQLSGGQKQRLAIARALLKNPCILILDEATSALDRKNEREIQTTLDEISEGRTTISIAHRLTTIQHADRILVFEKGKIVEEGSHNQLVDKKRVYYTLQHLQLQNQEEEDEGKNKKNHGVDIADGSDEGLEVAEERPDLRRNRSNNKEKDIQISSNQDRKKSEAFDIEKGAEPIVQDQAQYTTKASKKDEAVTGRLISFNKERSLMLGIGLIFAGLNGTLFPITGLVLSSIIDVFANPSSPDFHHQAVLHCMYFVALSGAALVFNTLQLACLNLVGENLSKNLRIAVFKKYLVSEIGWHDLPENSPGVLMAKLARDASLVNSLASTLLGTYVQAISAFITGMVIAFIASWQLTLVSLVVSPITVLGGAIEGKFQAGFSDSDDRAYRESSSFVSEAVNNMRTVASFAREDKLLKNYEDKLQEPLKKAVRKGHLSGLAYGFAQFSYYFVFAVIFIIGAVFVVHINLGFKDLFQSVLGVFYAAMGAGYSMQYAGDVRAAHAAAVSIFRLLDRTPEIRHDDPNQNIRTPIKGDIEFKNVWFRYPSRPKDILKGVSFKINAGSQVAFVGTSGCGKSTIMSLLQRFYDPTQGEIFIDGIDIKKYELRHLRNTFGVVSQEPTLFNGSIEYNIRYNTVNASFEDIHKAAAEANALGFIERNEFDDQQNTHNLENNNQKGFNKNVGPKGSQISGGQKQRIAIARAILKKPSVLLLDEATSALDAQSEKVVQDSLDNIMKGKTAIIIAHRISTIRGTDEILVFNEGQIIERGKYEHLVEKRGVFYKLENGLDINS